MPRLIDADRLKADFIGNRYGTQAIEYVIDQQPTVDAEPVNHRHWVTVRNPMLYQTIPYAKVCSGCLTAFPYEMPYCGECGAKMDEEVNEVQEVKDGVIISINKED